MRGSFFPSCPGEEHERLQDFQGRLCYQGHHNLQELTAAGLVPAVEAEGFVAAAEQGTAEASAGSLGSAGSSLS